MEIVKTEELALQIAQQSLGIAKLSEESGEDFEIELEIRKHYSLSQELAIHRKLCVGVYTQESPEVIAYNNVVTNSITKVRNAKANHQNN